MRSLFIITILLLMSFGKVENILAPHKEISVFLGNNFTFGPDSIWANGDEDRIYLWKGYSITDTIRKTYTHPGAFFFNKEGTILFAGGQAYDINKRQFIVHAYANPEILTDPEKVIIEAVRDPYTGNLVISSKTQPRQQMYDAHSKPGEKTAATSRVIELYHENDSPVKMGAAAVDDFTSIVVNKEYICCLSGNKILVWNKKHPQKAPDTLPAGSPVNKICFTPDQLHLAAVDDAGKVSFWNIRKKTALVFTTMQKFALDIAFHPGKDYFVIASADHKVGVWSWQNQQANLAGEISLDQDIKGISFDKEGKRLFVKSGLNDLKIYDFTGH